MKCETEVRDDDKADEIDDDQGDKEALSYGPVHQRFRQFEVGDDAPSILANEDPKMKVYRQLWLTKEQDNACETRMVVEGRSSK